VSLEERFPLFPLRLLMRTRKHFVLAVIAASSEARKTTAWAIFAGISPAPGSNPALKKTNLALRSASVNPSLPRRGIIIGALVHSRAESEITRGSKLLCHDRLATDRMRTSGRQHPVQHCHADGSLGLLSGKAACPQPWPISDS
jgi:hypothetical protein